MPIDLMTDSKIIYVSFLLYKNTIATFRDRWVLLFLIDRDTTANSMMTTR